MPTRGSDVRSTRLFRAVAGILGAAALTAAAVASQLTPATSAAAAAPPAADRVAPTAQGAAAAQPGVAKQVPIPPVALPCPLTLTVVAHEDDDLLFINPSVSVDIAAGRCVVTLFVTAGDAGRTRSYWAGREQGSMDAYAAMAGVASTWRADTITLAGHVVHRFRLTGSQITQLYLRLPDAHGAADRPTGTLRHLWLGSVHNLYTVDSHALYTRQTLISTLTAAMTAYRPTQIRTLDYAGHYADGDHDDHHTVGYLTLAAQRNYRVPHSIAAYMGYEVAEHPENLDPATAQTKLDYFLTYAAHDDRVCQSADTCQANFYAPRFTHRIVTATTTTRR